MTKVNVATLKAELSKYLGMAQKGQHVIVTSHGREIAKIGPSQTVDTPPVDWKEFFAKRPPVKPRKKGTPAAQLIREIRDEG
ncbi:MAG: type II toxin-antitoxin system prevent-host-death family antitoxin [Bdellovibrionota bacterium]